MNFLSRLQKQSKVKANSEDRLGLDRVVFRMPGTNVDISVRHLLEGSVGFGSSGSGKSTGWAKHQAMAMLRAGFGFCVLCVKPGERKTWEEYVRRTNRDDDLVIFDKNSPYKFDVLNYEVSRSGDGAGEIINLINLLLGIEQQIQIHKAGSSSNEGEQFWVQSKSRLIEWTITLLKLAGFAVTVGNMRKLVSSCFNENDAERFFKLQAGLSNPDLDREAKLKIFSEYKSFVESSFFLTVYEKANLRPNMDMEELEQMEMASEYWLNDFPRLAPKTRGIILESFQGVLQVFGKGILKEKFSSGLSEELLPENIYKKSKVVIVDFSVKEFKLAGIYAATLYKMAFQSCMERRIAISEETPVPVCLWIDEYHSLCSPLTDSIFQSICRESLVASVYITQNINGLLFAMGSHMPEARAKSLIGNMNLKYFNSNSDFLTNDYASEIIGEHFVDTESVTIRGNERDSYSYNQILRRKVPVGVFTTLKTGGPAWDYTVSCIVFKAGMTWDREGSNYAMVEFDQRAE